MRRFLSSILLISGCLAVPARGDLTWQYTELSTSVQTGQDEVIVEFPFTNKGKTPVEITSIRRSCGCTTLNSVEGTYQPGESGEVRATVRVKKRLPEQTQQIVITTRGTKPGTEILNLRISTQTDVVTSKQTLSWELNDPLEEQSFDLWIKDPALDLKELVPGHKLSARLEKIAERHFRVFVSPLSENGPAKVTH